MYRRAYGLIEDNIRTRQIIALSESPPSADDDHAVIKLKQGIDSAPQSLPFTELPPQLRNIISESFIPTQETGGDGLIITCPHSDRLMVRATQPDITRASR